MPNSVEIDLQEFEDGSDRYDASPYGSGAVEFDVDVDGIDTITGLGSNVTPEFVAGVNGSGNFTIAIRGVDNTTGAIYTNTPILNPDGTTMQGTTFTSIVTAWANNEDAYTPNTIGWYPERSDILSARANCTTNLKLRLLRTAPLPPATTGPINLAFFSDDTTGREYFDRMKPKPRTS